MNPVPTLSVVAATGARARLEAARGFLASCPPAAEAVVVAASREAADELVRAWSSERGATFGLHRFSYLQFAMRVASLELARAGLAPATRLGGEAVAARAAFQAAADASLEYLGPVAGFRGFVRALAATLDDVRRGGVAPAALDALGASGRDLALLARRFDAELADAQLADRASLLGLASRAVAGGTAGVPLARPLLLLDVAIDSSADATFVAGLVRAAPRALATVPIGDDRTLAALTTIAGRAPVVVRDDGDDELSRLRRRLFAIDERDRIDSPEAPSLKPEAACVSFFSAPGEGREAIEIARRVLEEARRGVRFDEMAIVLRAPGVYAGLVETALDRAGVPAWFARGTSTPHPAGRAFLAVLACAAEGLSARRFAEYLSLGQVPVPGPAGAPVPVEPPWVPADPDEQPLPDAASAAGTPMPTGQLSLFDEATRALSPTRGPRGSASGLSESVTSDRKRTRGPAPDARRPEPSTAASPEVTKDTDDVPVLEGTLRAPWKWERLLVESAVIGGGRERWVRRLDGLASELGAHRRELVRSEPDSPHVARVDRDLRDLEHLRRFALPVIDALVALPGRAAWGEWLDALDRLAPLVLRRPERVLAILAELRPMSSVGPVTLEEVQHVLVERLSVSREEPPSRRYGRVFIGTPEQLRGRLFRVVFVPGLAERIFPQRSRQDPLLLDDARRGLAPAARDSGPALPTRDDRASGERALLHLSAGAASERLWLSYPRMELTQSRPRVPSFYALDVERALTGRVPDYRELEDQAYLAAEARLAWPAPPDPARAIDDTEHDLSVLGRLLRFETPAAARGRARYLLDLNPALRRSLLFRFARWQKKWSASDGLYKPGPEALAALARHRPGVKAYSVSALQKFATCPYQFFLSAVHRLEPRKEIAPLEKMDPLTRGSIFHRVQAELMRVLQKQRKLPVTGATLREAERQLDQVLDRIAADERDELAPAIDRVWRDEIESMRGDLRGWLQRVADEGGEWTPLRAEWGFGFPPAEGRDPASTPEPVVLDGRWKLHGFVDLIEERAALLRVTDHKTGKARAPEGFIVGGGEVLQPVLYGMAVEQALGRPVVAGRLFYCTSAGAFTERAVVLGPMERRHGLEVIEIVDRAVEQGFLPPVPRARACEWCDFREVCGPDEERRSARKPSVPPLEELMELRKLP